MRADVSTTTNAGECVLFDPQAVWELLRAGFEHRDRIDEAVRRGNILVWGLGGNGDLSVRVYVDESPDAEIARRADHPISDRLLRVPSGRLVVTGLEAFAEEQALEDPAQYRPRVAFGEVRMPPGDYKIEAFDVEWGDEHEDEVDAHVAKVVGARAATWSSLVATLPGLLMVTTIFVLPLVLFVLYQVDTDLLWRTVKLGLPIYAALWVVIVSLWRLPQFRRVRQMREELQRAFPGSVVVMRRVRAGESMPERGGAFGCAYWGTELGPED